MARARHLGEHALPRLLHLPAADRPPDLRREVVLVGAHMDHLGVDALGDFATNDTGAFFAIVNNRSITTTAAFTNRGQFQLGGGSSVSAVCWRR